MLLARVTEGRIPLSVPGYRQTLRLWNGYPILEKRSHHEQQPTDTLSSDPTPYEVGTRG
jgi:hypothetical protein